MSLPYNAGVRRWKGYCSIICSSIEAHHPIQGWTRNTFRERRIPTSQRPRYSGLSSVRGFDQQDISRYFGCSDRPSWAYFAVLQCPSLNIVHLPVIGVLQWFESTPWDGYLRDVFRWVGMMLDGKVLEIIYQSEIASTRQAVLMPPPYVNATPTGDNFLFKMACDGMCVSPVYVYKLGVEQPLNIWEQLSWIQPLSLPPTQTSFKCSLVQPMWSKTTMVKGRKPTFTKLCLAHWDLIGY